MKINTCKPIPNSLEAYASLPEMTPEELDKLGLHRWETKPAVSIHWLYPLEWYDYIPDGLEIVSILGKVTEFEHGMTDKDDRGGAMAFGFIQDAVE